MQVVYCENFEDSDVNKKDFFHNASSMLLDPELDMFIQNDTNTLVWFPSEVRHLNERKKMRSIFNPFVAADLYL